MEKVVKKSKTGKEVFTFRMTQEEYQQAGLDYLGLCIACGEERYECEPDARHYECDACGKNSVFGVECELLMMGYIEIVDEQEHKAENE